MVRFRHPPIMATRPHPPITAPAPRHITKGYGFVVIIIAMGHGSLDTGDKQATRKTSRNVEIVSPRSPGSARRRGCGARSSHAWQDLELLSRIFGTLSI